MEVKLVTPKLARALRFSLGVAFVLLYCFAAAQAQNNSAGSSTANENDSSAQQTPPTAEGKTGDRISNLRAQIAAAKTGAERLRLERTLVDYLIALGRKDEALTELRAMAHEDLVDPVAFYNVGNALARLGDRDAAIESYRKAIKQRNGNYSHAQNNLGVLLMRQEKLDEAQEAFQAALKNENNRYGEASYNLGRLYAQRGETELAMRAWNQALVAQPDHADAAIALARAYAAAGQPERGVALLDTFIARGRATTEIMDARREILKSSEQ